MLSPSWKAGSSTFGRSFRSLTRVLGIRLESAVGRRVVDAVSVAVLEMERVFILAPVQSREQQTCWQDPQRVLFVDEGVILSPALSNALVEPRWSLPQTSGRMCP